MKLAIYTGVLGSGGIEAVAVNHALFFAQMGLMVDYIIDLPPSNVDYYQSLTTAGVRVKTLFDKRPKLFIVKKVFRLISLIREEKYTCFHFHLSYPSSLLYVFVVKLLGVPSVTTSHARGTMKSSPYFKIYQNICRHLFAPASNNRYAVSQEAGLWLYGNKKFDVMFNPINVDRFKYSKENRTKVRDHYGLDDKILLVGHVGRLDKVKNHRFLIETFSEMVKQNPLCRLLIIGSGGEEENIKQTISQHKLNNYVFYVNHTDCVERYLSAMDVLVFPSIQEGLPTVLLEAQASNLPIIASTGVPRQIALSNNVSFLDLNDGPLFWAQKVFERVSRGEPRNSTNELLQSKCSINRICSELIDIYSNISLKRN